MKNSNFKPGDKVVCINDNFDLTKYGSHLIHQWPKKYDIYTIRSVYNLNMESLFFEELVNSCDGDNNEPSFLSFRFRKVIIDDYRMLIKNAIPKEETHLKETHHGNI